MKTARTTMTLMSQQDIPEVLEMFKEKDTFRYIKGLQGKTEQEYRAFLALKITEIQQGNGFYWIIRESTSGEFIGAINLTPIPKTKDLQLGWQIKDRFRRKGLALETAQKAMEFALEETDFDPLYIVYEAANEASARISRRLNFTLAQTERTTKCLPY